MSSLKFMLSIFSFFPLLLFGHGDDLHTQKQNTVDKRDAVYESINADYLRDIRPIFEKKCFDCHSNKTKFPWYYKIPGIKHMIDYDIKKAKKHIDMSDDFPFISHDIPLMDLKSIKKVVSENDMPPFRYVLGHWDSRLNEDEKRVIINWSEKSILKLINSSYK